MLEVSLINILSVAIIGNMIAHWFDPLQSVKIRLGNIPILSQILNCSKCSAFWLGIGLFYSIIPAALSAFLAFVINFVIDKIESWYE